MGDTTPSEVNGVGAAAARAGRRGTGASVQRWEDGERGRINTGRALASRRCHRPASGNSGSRRSVRATCVSFAVTGLIGGEVRILSAR